MWGRSRVCYWCEGGLGASDYNPLEVYRITERERDIYIYIYMYIYHILSTVSSQDLAGASHVVPSSEVAYRAFQINS